MGAYRKFDPGAFLAEIEERGGGTAKAAKVAKVERAAGQTLATLAALAGGDPESANFGQPADATYPSAFEERAAIVEFDAGMSRAEAEARAYECAIVEWLNRNPAPSGPGQCTWCGKTEAPGAIVLPFGTETHGHAWLHPGCWRPWHDRRRAEAIAALSAMGIAAPANLPDDFGKNGGP